MPADLDEKALAALKGVCDHVEAVRIHGSPPLVGFEWRLGRARAAILAYEAARAKALPSDVQSVVERLRATTEEMANHASIAMDLWDRHSHAALEAATLLETLARGQEWQPIEKAPKDGTKVLIWNAEGHEIAWWEDACPDSPDQPGDRKSTRLNSSH